MTECVHRSRGPNVSYEIEPDSITYTPDGSFARISADATENPRVSKWHFPGTSLEEENRHKAATASEFGLQWPFSGA